MIRFSKDSDLQELKALGEMCFGDREKAGIYNNLNGRYLVYEIDGKIVAMAGLSFNSPYPSGVEMSWVCVHPDYRHKGIMFELFSRLIALTDEDIYCSCWHLSDKEYPNIHKIVSAFGFECVCEKHIQCNLHRCGMVDKKGCVYYKEDCSCMEDLYVRRMNKENVYENNM